MESVILKIGSVLQKHPISNDDCSGLTIGRAFTNDVILADPYVGASQMEINVSRDDEGRHDWLVTNVDTTNPVFLNNINIESAEFNVSSGDEITIGRTNISVFSENHCVHKTREFSFTNWLHSHKFKPLIATVMLAFLFVIALWMTYLEMSSELDWGELSVVSIIAVVVAIIWASGWSFTGYLIKGHHYFFSHLFFTSVCFSLYLIVGDLYSYVEYSFSSSLVGEIVDWLLSILFLGLLIGFNLALISYAPRVFKKGLVASTLFLGVIAFLSYQDKDEYSNEPVHTAIVKPSYIPTTAVLGVDNYIKNYHVLFDKLSATAE